MLRRFRRAQTFRRGVSKFFEKKKDRQYGVKHLSGKKFQFALPVTTGTKPAITDYLPAPFRLAGFFPRRSKKFIPRWFLNLTMIRRTLLRKERLIPAGADGKTVRITWQNGDASAVNPAKRL